MPEHESVRSTAEAIGRITCITTGAEIGLLYQWNNGQVQAALYDEGHPKTPHCSDHPAEPDIGARRS